jgi:hypothetical protein
MPLRWKYSGIVQRSEERRGTGFALANGRAHNFIWEWVMSYLVSVATTLFGAGAMAVVLLVGRGGVTTAEGQPAPPVAAAPAPPAAAASAPPAAAPAPPAPAAKPASRFFFSPASPPAPEPQSGGDAAARRAAEPAARAGAAFFYGGVPDAEAYGAHYDYPASDNGTASAQAPQQYSAAPATTGRLPLNLFSLVGIPNNSGEILWPLAFRLLPDTQRTNRLLLQTNSQFLAAMGQSSAQARPDAAVMRALRQSLSQVRFTLVQSEATLGNGIYSEARDFLNRLDQAVTLLAQER